MYNKKSIIIIIILLFTSISIKAQSEIKLVDKKEVKQLIAKSKGKVLLINVWATWCLPCVKEFPDLVKLHNNYKGKGLDFLSLSVDFGKDAKEKVINFLEKQKARFPAYIIKEKSSEEVINYLNKKWTGAVPATFIYDKTNKQIKYFEGIKTYKELEEAIKGEM